LTNLLLAAYEQRRLDGDVAAALALSSARAMRRLIHDRTGAVGSSRRLGEPSLRPPHDAAHDTDTFDRSTFVLDPGIGQFTDRGLVLANAGLYQHFGFSSNFLWYAPATERVVAAGESWASCTAGTHVGGACPIGSVQTTSSPGCGRRTPAGPARTPAGRSGSWSPPRSAR
jgi:hypothetical protein